MPSPLAAVVLLTLRLGFAQNSATIEIPENKISRLALDSVAQVVAAPAGSDTPIAARVLGTFDSNLDRLLFDGVFVSGGEKGKRISVLVPIVAEQTEVQVTQVAPTGELVSETVLINFADFSRYRPPLSAHKKWRFGLGTGIHRLDYAQTAFSDFSVLSLPVVFHAFYEMNPNQIKWSAHIDGFVSAATLQNTSTSAVRDLRISARLAYGFRQGNQRWRLQPQFGAVLRSMLVTPADFGYYGSVGLELSPSLTYATEKSGFFHLMPRYVFVASGLSDGEWAVRLRWTYAVRPGLVLFLAGEYASFWATTSTASGSVRGTLWSRQWLVWLGFQI